MSSLTGDGARLAEFFRVPLTEAMLLMAPDYVLCCAVRGLFVALLQRRPGASCLESSPTSQTSAPYCILQG